jgi:hypothetical protein
VGEERGGEQSGGEEREDKETDGCLLTEQAEQEVELDEKEAEYIWQINVKEIGKDEF